MLAMDAFCGHLYNIITNMFRNKNTGLESIPSGMTSQLQPLDMSTSIPFKYLVHKYYYAWLNKDNHIMTPNGKIKRTSTPIIVEWKSKAWKEVPVNIIKKSFLFCSKVCLMWKMKHKITFFEATVNKVASLHHL
jgi:hypothetical protein